MTSGFIPNSLALKTSFEYQLHGGIKAREVKGTSRGLPGTPGLCSSDFREVRAGDLSRMERSIRPHFRSHLQTQTPIAIDEYF